MLCTHNYFYKSFLEDAEYEADSYGLLLTNLCMETQIFIIQCTSHIFSSCIQSCAESLEMSCLPLSMEICLPADWAPSPWQKLCANQLVITKGTEVTTQFSAVVNMRDCCWERHLSQVVTVQCLTEKGTAAQQFKMLDRRRSHWYSHLT